MKFKNLIQTLETQINIYKEYIEIEKSKTNAVVNSDIIKLDGILSSEEILYMKSQSYEKKRINIMKSLNLENKTLLEVIDFAEGKEKDRLSEILEELSFYIDELKQVNECNKKLVKSRLDIISAITESFKDPEGKSGKNGGKIKYYGKNAKIAEQVERFDSSVIRKRI